VDPCLGLGVGPASYPKPLPVFLPSRFYTGERQTPVCGVRHDFLRRKSGYPPALPVFLLPSFLNEGESRPLLETCAAAPPVEGGRLSVSPTRVPASEFLYEGEDRPLFQVGCPQEGPREPVSLPEHLPPTRLQTNSPAPLRPPDYPSLPPRPVRVSPSCLSRGRSPLLVMCDTVHPPHGEATASIHHPYPCPCFRVFIRGGSRLLLAMCDTSYPPLFQGRKSRSQSIAATRVPACEFLYEEQGRLLLAGCPCLRVFIRGGRQTPVWRCFVAGRPAVHR